MLPAGVPPGSETAYLALPECLAEQIAGLQFSAGGLHTEFVRLDRMIERLRSQGSDAVVLVLGEKPSAYLITEGTIAHCGEGALSPAEASGWIVVYSGKVRAAAATQPRTTAEHSCAAGEIYFAIAGGRNPLPEEVAAGILEVAGPGGHAVPGLLDGSRTIAVVADMTGLSAEQVRAAVGVLMAHRLAFRNVSRSRPVP